MEIQNNNDNNGNNNGSKGGKALLIVGVAVLIVAVAGFIPWERLTGGKMKDFNLLSDVLSVSSVDDDGADDIVEVPLEDDTIAAVADSISMDRTGDSVMVASTKPSRLGELVVLEDYTHSGAGLSALASKIGSGSLARIAVVGDSYIEGDIMSQDLRALMQERYGGSGVGYMNLHSDFPGFRRSVSQGGNKNWKNYTATKRGKEQYMWLAEQYSTPSGEAKATYKGTNALYGADKWQTARILAVAPEGAKISTKVGKDGEWTEHTLASSPEVQMIEVASPDMAEFSLKSSTASAIILGVWLDGDRGVSVDCMSSRGIPGYTLAKVSPELSRQMGQYIDYDLIILEFGVNAMSAKQKNYSVFANNMVKVIENLRQCYPSASFLLMGVGDRGERRNGQVHSMSTIKNMIDAQREAAMRAGVLFWDTREAMGGEDAIVEWSGNGRANKDYIHLTHKGGASLAKLLFDAIEHSMH